MSYATKLRAALDARGMRQGELAKASGVSASQISMYLGGHSEPRPEAALRIAEALGVPPEALHDTAPVARDCSDRNVPVTEAAKLLGLSPEVLREALKCGVVNFGFAVKCSGEQYVYHISPHKLREYIGAPAMAQR